MKKDKHGLANITFGPIDENDATPIHSGGPQTRPVKRSEAILWTCTGTVQEQSKTPKEQAAEMMAELEWQKDWCYYVLDLFIDTLKQIDDHGGATEYWCEVKQEIENTKY